MKESPIVLEAENLCKKFDSVVAVDGVSFGIRRGTVAGFVGKNGAGKTTTMRILIGLEVPSGGRARICGEDVVENPGYIRIRVGWMPDTCGVYSNTTVWEYLDFFARAHGLSSAERRRRIECSMEQTALGPLARSETMTLSRGMLQRLSLARALLHRPEVLILDEPAAGLDPEARLQFKTLVRTLANQGTTCLISSHILSELAEMCDELLFLHRGKIVRHAPIKDLLREGMTVVHVRFNTGPFREWAEAAPSVRLDALSSHEARIVLSGARNEMLADFLKTMILAGVEVTEFTVEERKLEEVFMETIRQSEEAAQ